MATINGFIRSYAAASRRIERQQQREAREAARLFKEQQKLQAIDDAREAVHNYWSYVRMLKSLHVNCTDSVDWNAIKAEPRPPEPSIVRDEEKEAVKNFKSYKPSIIDRWFGLANRKKAKLHMLVKKAKENDNKVYEVRMKRFKRDLSVWEQLQRISQGIENKDPESYKKAIEFFDPFSDVSELGTHLSLTFTETLADVDIKVNSIDIIPDYEINQTSTGKLSKKSMPKSKFNELYQDHICSTVIRIARELFAYLPVQYVRINALAELLNSKTGHLEQTPILSVIIPPLTINSMNLATIDPSDSMQNFVHNMNFNKSNGFKSVEKVELIV